MKKQEKIEKNLNINSETLKINDYVSQEIINIK